jgi:hypothetical protein
LWWAGKAGWRRAASVAAAMARDMAVAMVEREKGIRGGEEGI